MALLIAVISVLGGFGCTASEPSRAPSRVGPDLSCKTRPSSDNTGANSVSAQRTDTKAADNAVIENVSVPSLDISGNDVTVRNVKVDGNIFIRGDRVSLDHVTTTGISISSASDVTIQYANIGFGADDGIHITSDRGRKVARITLEYNYIHDPRVEPTAHYDGTQIRGADTVSIVCSNYDPGPYQPQFNAAIYLEDANGGDTGVTIRNNWLTGFGYSVMIDAKDTKLVGNAVGGNPKWGLCYLAKGLNPGAVSSVDNVDQASNRPISLCAGPST